ncbi:hypothetical protein [Streptomyces sp. NPDC016845]|uniref:hypothetical protein n=1 Tax=Streptomyces sp. NPDC016845 TaxID=3364972 RepID=UPI003796022E
MARLVAWWRESSATRTLAGVTGVASAAAGDAPRRRSAVSGDKGWRRGLPARQ